MKLILSRKGFDSSAGGVPSPIFPDGSMVTLPIPDRESVITYQDIRHGGGSLGPIVSDLTGGRIKPQDGAHIDPDLIEHSLPRARGWRPVFGQSGAAQSHLRNHGVGPGDLFLFFGLFRCVERAKGAWAWAPGSRPRHVIWGWLQVDKMVKVADLPTTTRQWADYHPHLHRECDANNAIYLASRKLTLNGATETLAGAGIFTRFAQERLLTAPHANSPSPWQLPHWFYPGKGRAPLTYHGARHRWRRTDDVTHLQSVARGQEFILDGNDYPETIGWVRELSRQR